MLRSPGGCIAFVPISPDVMKIPLGAWFGVALSRLFMPTVMDEMLNLFTDPM